MTTVQSVFKRYERKYLINKEQYEILMANLVLHMNVDCYGWHTISNIYFDTENYEFIRNSIEKPVYKEKLRLRGYGDLTSDGLVFMELKKKFDGVVYKRRVPMTLAQAARYIEYNEKPKKDSQILNEIDWFIKRYHPKPKVLIAYDRIAFSGKEDSKLRITFDHNIRYRDMDLNLAHGSHGQQLIDSNSYIMEIKIEGAIPLWLSQEMTELDIYPSSFSKYGTCYKNYLIKKVYSNGGIQIA